MMQIMTFISASGLREKEDFIEEVSFEGKD